MTLVRREVYEICVRCEEKINYFVTANRKPGTPVFKKKQATKKKFKYCHYCLAEVWEQQEMMRKRREALN